MSPQVVLVTGGRRGIGKATALAFAEAGRSVAVSSRRVGAARGTLVGELNEWHDQLRAVGQL